MSRSLPVTPLLAAATLLFSAAPLRAAAVHAGPAPTGTPWKIHAVDNAFRNPDGVKLADINRDGLPDITTGWEDGGVTRVYLHPGYAKVREPWPGVTVGVTPKAEDAVFVDLDGDGAFDVVSSTEGKERRIFVQWGPRNPADILNPKAWTQDRFPAVEGVTQWMFAQPLDIDGKNGIDLVLGGKNDDRSIPTFVGWLESPPNPRDTGAWRWHPLDAQVSWVMSIFTEDVNGDGLTDIIFTDKHGPWVGIHWLENPGQGAALTQPWKKHTAPIKGLVGTSFAAIADLDGDGRRDFIVSATLRTGEGEQAVQSHNLVFLRKLDGTGDRWEQHNIAAPANTGSPKGVSVADVNLDGKLDLVVSCSGAVGDLIGVYWLSYRQSVFDEIWDAHDISGPVGIKYDLVPLADFDGDGDLDVLSTEEKENDKKGLGVVWYENPTRSPKPAAAAAAPKAK